MVLLLITAWLGCGVLSRALCSKHSRRSLSFRWAVTFLASSKFLEAQVLLLQIKQFTKGISNLSNKIIHKRDPLSWNFHADEPLRYPALSSFYSNNKKKFTPYCTLPMALLILSHLCSWVQVIFLFCCFVVWLCVFCVCFFFFLIQSWDLQGYPSLQKAAYRNFRPALYLPVPILSPLFMRTTQNSFFTAQ